MLRVAVVLIVFLCLSSCGPPEQGGVWSSTSTNSQNEDEILLRLSNELIIQPRTRDQKEQNLILNYAIENLLNVERSASGMYFQILQPGKGSLPKASSTVEAHYVGRRLDGSIFDSSYSRGKPQQFRLSEVIPGWRQAIKMLKPGGKGIFLLPSRLAYGENGIGELIPPNTVLQFEIELIKVQ